MVANLFTELGTYAASFVTFLISLFTSVSTLIWDNGFTIVGQLIVLSMATGLVMWALWFIRSLIRVRRS